MRLLLLSAAQVSDSEPIRVVLPPSVDAAACQMHSFLVGSFGGAGDFARPKRGDHVVQIPTVNEDKIVGRSLKAYVWCPGYEAWTLALDSLPVPAKRTITPVLTPRVPVRFSGVIRAWAAPSEPLAVHVAYTPTWISLRSLYWNKDRKCMGSMVSGYGICSGGRLKSGM